MKTLDPEWEIPSEEIIFLSKTPIAKGAFSKIYRGKWRGLDVAIKVVNDEKKKQLDSEIHILTLVHHPNIVMFLGYSKMGRKTALVMEWLENGDLLDYLWKARRFPLTYKDRMRLSRDIIVALNYLHLRFPTSIVHRDLKPRNCLVTAFGHCKIADFGISKEISSLKSEQSIHSIHSINSINSINSFESINEDVDKSHGNVGTLRYMAPEIIHQKDKEHREIRKSKFLDIYSLSMVLYMIWEDQEVFSGISNKENFYEHIRNGERPKFRFTPLRLQSLIRLCWNENPSSRPTTTDIMQVLVQSPPPGESWKYNIYRNLFGR